MGSNENRLRKKWQDYSGKNATLAEKSFLEVFQTIFNGTEFEIRARPKEFSTIYIRELPLRL